MELVDRKTAVDLDLTRYFTGKPCKFGHIAERKTNNGSCVECSRLRTKRWREEGVQQNYNINGKALPSVEYLKECFEYKDGFLVWKERPRFHFSSEKGYKTYNKRFPNTVAGHYHTRNYYLEVRLDNKLYKGHRLIWKICTGLEPEGMVDHIDGDPRNNKIENLRLATSQENARNGRKRPRLEDCTSEYKGVSFHKNKWISYLTIDDTQMIEVFDSEIEAALSYDKRVLKYFGEFAKFNFPENIEKYKQVL